MKNKSIIVFILGIFESLTITEIILYCYLIDLAAINKLNGKITSYQFRRSYYGVYDKNIRLDINELLKEEIITRSIIEGVDSFDQVIYKKEKKLSNNKFKIKLEKFQKDFIKSFLLDIQDLPITVLIDLVYQTKPMKNINAKQNNENGLNKVIL